MAYSASINTARRINNSFISLSKLNAPKDKFIALKKDIEELYASIDEETFMDKLNAFLTDNDSFKSVFLYENKFFGFFLSLNKGYDLNRSKEILGGLVYTINKRLDILSELKEALIAKVSKNIRNAFKGDTKYIKVEKGKNPRSAQVNPITEGDTGRVVVAVFKHKSLSEYLEFEFDKTSVAAQLDKLPGGKIKDDTVREEFLCEFIAISLKCIKKWNASKKKTYKSYYMEHFIENFNKKLKEINDEILFLNTLGEVIKQTMESINKEKIQVWDNLLQNPRIVLKNI